MCEFCKKHAGNKSKWYFNPKNYSKEMGEARIELLEKVASKYHFAEWMINESQTIELFKNIPILNRIAVNLEEKYLEKTVGGQIITFKDTCEVLDLCENPALIPCECRRIAGKEKYCCISLGLIPELYKKANPDDYIEEVSVSKVKRLLREWDKEGLFHIILWSNAPYVTTICNCTAPYCLAYKERLVTGLKNAMLKGEYVARVNEEKCQGCKTCLTRCQFGAILFNVDNGKAFIDIRKCVGCGLCATECEYNAVELFERRFTPAKNLW
jgi:ferredoxin